MDSADYQKYEPVFGVWRITRLIGEGSFGKVFEMEREDFGVTYKAALKAITVPASQAELLDVKADGLDDASERSPVRGHGRSQRPHLLWFFCPGSGEGVCPHEQA